MSATLEAAPVTEPPPPPDPAPPAADLPLTVIEPRSGWQLVNLRELWRARELLYFLAWRDVAIRYKQTVLGLAWAFAQPLMTVVVFVVFLGAMGGIARGPDYALYVCCGIIPWTFFANAVNSAGMSVVANQNLVTKIYFPRLILPASSACTCLFDFVISLGLLGAVMLWYRDSVALGWHTLLAPLCVALLLAAALGAGTFLAALIVAHRDFKYVLSFGVQLWMFATPCIYLRPDAVGPTAQTWLPLNPAYGLIKNFRAALLGGPPDWYALGVSAAVAAAALAVALAYFRRVERSFVDVI